MDKNKKYSLILLGVASICLLIVAGLTIYVDPFSHYHLPNKNFRYYMYDSRYNNDGLMRHYKYDAIITGTSMTENFKTSEFDKLFNVTSIKVPFPGATYKEIDDNIKRALVYNPNIKYIIRGLDYSKFYDKADAMRESDEFYPTYLTNESIIDDVYYLFNKSVFENTLKIFMTYSKSRNFEINFDEIYNWNDRVVFGKKAVLSQFKRKDKIPDQQSPSQQEILDFKKNINVNLVETVQKNPDIQFYYFLTPYSICWWDSVSQENKLEKHLYGERMIIEALIQYDNVHLFSFSNDFDIITDFNNYKDLIHYSEDINRYMLEKMSRDENRLTENNYQEYLKEIYEFYSTYDYDSIYE